MATITAAVDSAAYGDTVLVHSGGSPYTQASGETFPIALKNGVTLTAVESHVVDVCREVPLGGVRGSVLTCTGVDSTAVVNGINFRFGDYDEAWPPESPVFECVNSSPRISDCYFKGTASSTDGAGVLCTNSSPRFDECWFHDNENTTGVGGAGCLIQNASRALFARCRFSENLGLLGGGVRVDSTSEAGFDRCWFDNNVGNMGGGAIYNEGSVALSSCTLARNSTGAQNEGSALHCFDGASCSIDACLIAHNDGSLPVVCGESVAISISSTDIYEPLMDPWAGNIASEYGYSNDNFYAEPFFTDLEGSWLNLFDNSPCLPGLSPSGELVGCFDAAVYSYAPKTLLVPSEYATIGEAMAAATATDTIRVSEGTYCYDETFPLRLHSGWCCWGRVR